MNYLSGLYRRVKVTIAGFSGIAAIGALIAGIAIGGVGGTVLIVGGSLWTVTAAFSIFDSVATHSAIAKDVKKLEKNVDTFSDENTRLHGDIDLLEQAKDDYVEQNRVLATSLHKSENQIKKLCNLKQKFEDANKEYKCLLDVEKKEVITLQEQNVIYIKENDRIRESLNSMMSVQRQIQEENKVMGVMLEEHKNQVSSLEKAKDAYVSENDRLQGLNDQSEEQVKTLETQVGKLKGLYTSSVELLENLKHAGDEFSNFNSMISVNVEDLDGVASEMKVLVDTLKKRSFSDMDADGDGTVTKEEFDKYVESNK